jgi:hypothetical protein
MLHCRYSLHPISKRPAPIYRHMHLSDRLPLGRSGQHLARHFRQECACDDLVHVCGRRSRPPCTGPRSHSPGRRRSRTSPCGSPAPAPRSGSALGRRTGPERFTGGQKAKAAGSARVSPKIREMRAFYKRRGGFFAVAPGTRVARYPSYAGRNGRPFLSPVARRL